MMNTDTRKQIETASAITASPPSHFSPQAIMLYLFHLETDKRKSKNILIILPRQSAQKQILPEGLGFIPFRFPCPVECGAYSSGVSEKE